MLYAHPIDGVIELYSDQPFVDKERIISIPGTRWKGSQNVWTAPLTWATCLALRGVFTTDLTISPELNQWAFDELDNRITPARALRSLFTDDHDDYRKYAPRYEGHNDHDAKLYPFQRVGRSFMITAGDSLICDEMGTGKTVQVLSALRLMEDQYPAIIICPNTLKLHWAKHIEKWLPEATPFPLIGTLNARRKALEAARHAVNPIVIVNIEGVRSLSRMSGYGNTVLKACAECDPLTGIHDLSPNKCQKHVKELNMIPFTTVIMDEAHRIKDPSAQQTRAVWAVCAGKTVRRRIAMTGTPVANSPGDLWSIMHAVVPGEYPNRSKFINRYAQVEYDYLGYRKITGLNPDTSAELFGFFDPRMRRILKAQVLPDLPEKVRITRTVDMSPKQATAYKEMAERMATRLDDGKMLVASTNLVALTRLLQFTSSYCLIDRDEDADGNPNDDISKWKVTPCAPSPKIDEMVDILDELGCREWDGTGKSVVVAAVHAKLLRLVAERLDKEGIEYVEVVGSVSERARALNVEVFQAGKVPVLLMTYAAGGVGLTMTRADTMVRLQRPWSLIDSRQGEDRVHRMGSEVHESVTIIDLVTDNTVEVEQMRRLAEKLDKMEQLMRDRESLQAAGLSTEALDAEEKALLASHLTIDE